MSYLTKLIIPIFLLGIFLIGCSGKSSSPIMPSDVDQLSQPVSADHGPGGQMLGAYMVNLDSKTQSVEIEPVRFPAAIGDSFLLGITQGGPAGKWFQINGIQYVSHDDTTNKDLLRLSVEFQHPFPISARPDLCGWDLKAILVYNGTPTNFSDLDVQMNPPVLKNAHGATGEWDAESDLVYPTAANIHQFRIISEDDRVVDPFDFHNPAGWNVFYPGMKAHGDLDIELNSGSSLNFMLFLTMSYETSATFANTINHPGEPGSRTNPIYTPPNGNSRSPWKIEIEQTGSGMIDDPSSTATFDVRVWDWQHAKSGTNSQIKRVYMFVPGVTTTSAMVTTFTGTGRGTDPVAANVTITNDMNAPEGDYPGLVKVKDNLTGVPGVVTGIKTDWKTTFQINTFDSYQNFNLHITHYDPVNTSLFDVALEKMGKVRADLKMGNTGNSCWIPTDTQYMFPLTAESKMADFDSYHQNPLVLPAYVDSFTTELRTASTEANYSDILKAISQRAGYPIGPFDYTYTSTATPLLDAIISFHTRINDPLSMSEKNQITTDASDIPESVQIIAAKVLKGEELAWGLNEEAWADFNQQTRDDLYTGGLVYWTVIEDMQYGKFTQAGGEIASAFEDIRPALETFSDTGTYTFEWETPVGKIVIKGSGNDTYSGNGYLLVIDTGGDDTYTGSVAGTTNEATPAAKAQRISVCVDFSGNDNYGSSTQQFSQGGAYCGIAAQWDFKGSDVYTGSAYNQGAAYYGCGFLIDSEGDDQYNGDQLAQAAGNWGGHALLLDEKGTDRYYSFTASQAFSYTRGSGTLLDVSGDDQYIADDVDIRYPSPQSDQHNSSMSQAAGFGWRNDPYYLAGGIATLIDYGGKDTYSCGVFGQSTAFMFGSSILRDFGPEDDTFTGVWYVQSGNAHMGVSFFSNEAGNDKYSCLMNVGHGGAHDFSQAWFLDGAGDDEYTAPGISLGGGNEVGIGFFIDYDGTDKYNCTQDNSLGGGTYSDARARNSYGVFVDDGGDTDTYDHANAGNDTSWTHGGIGGGADGQSS